MHDSIPAERVTRLAVATFVAGILVAGCGGAGSTTAASPPHATITASRSPKSSPKSSPTASASTAAATASGPGGPGVAFARCMRSNGVPNFPDPISGPGVGFPDVAGLDRTSPAFRAAQATCRRFMPLPNFNGAPPSIRTLTKLRTIAGCMRAHGVPQFPDPTAARPPMPPGPNVQEITDFDGAFLLFPTTLDMQSPAYVRAADACGPLAMKLGRGPH